MANKIIHKRSSALLENGKPKLPTADNLEYGELAINFAKGAETISFKNKADEIVTISSTERLEQIIIDNEKVTAAALTDLDERMLAVENKGSLTIDDVYAEGFLTYVPSEYITESELADKGYLTSIPANYVTESELEAALSTVDVDLSDYMTIDELEETYASKDDLSAINTTIEENELVISNALTQLNNTKADVKHTHNEFETINTTIEENELVIANALNDLNERMVLLENVNASIAIANLNNQITTMQQTITELQAEIETMKTELNKTLTVE